jgi:RNA polymerase sigma-70 factor, ECF subfamily
LNPRPLATNDARSAAEQDVWLERFHRGEREVLARCYEDYVRTVAWAVRPLVDRMDQETVVHEVFCRLFGSPEARRSFSGGNLGAWLITVARRQAIDHRRRTAREELTADGELGEVAAPDTVDSATEDVELRVLVARFRERVLPPKWEPVFQARFLEQLDQREAARRLGIPRTTLAYQELRIRALLQRFMLEEDP